MNKLLLAASASILFATPAAAQNFTGFRGEARVGYDNVTLEAGYVDDVEAIELEDSRDGLGIGAEIGYDFAASPNFVVGVYGGVDFSETEYCTEIVGDDLACLETGRNFSAGLRAGGLVTPSTLIYVKGGYSNGRLKASYEDDIDSVEDSASRSGWHAGAGVEQAFGRAYAKLEYVFTNYNGAEYADEDFSIRADGRRQQVMLGAGFRF